MKKILGYLREYKSECVLAPLFKMLEASFELTVPIVIAYMIDNGKGNNSVCIKCFLILLALGAVGLAASATAQFFAAKAATGFSKNLRHDLFEHILQFDFKHIDDIGTSTLITRLTADVNTLQNGVNMFLRLFLRSPFIVAGALVMAFTIDFVSALVFAAVIGVLAVIICFIMKSNIPLLKKTQKGLDEVLKITRENLLGARVIRAFAIEDNQLDRFREKNENLTKLSLVAGRVSALLNPLTYVVINLGIVVLIINSGIRVDAGILSVGQVVALYNYMSQILLELVKFANLIITMNKAIASAGRVNDIFAVDTAESLCKCPDKAEGGFIEFDNVSFKYNDEGDEAVSNVSFRINKGETFGIIGGTGAGKTTIASLLTKQYEATKGEIYIDGKNVRGISFADVNARIGLCFQKAVLFEGTIEDNLLWGNESASEKDILDAIRISASDTVVEEKGGLKAEVLSGGKNFSGGQRQRLAIARALVKRPEILILDDSFSALDYLTDLRVRGNLRNLDYNPTVIIIAQRCSSIIDADNILVLDDGNVIGLGKHEELLNNCSVYKEIYDSQTIERGGGQ